MTILNNIFLIAPTVISTNEEITGTIARSEKRLLESEFPNNGLTLKIDIQVGDLVVYGSFTIRNPTPLTADFSVTHDEKEIDYFVSPELYRSSTNADGDDYSTISDDYSTSGDSGSQANVYFSIVGLEYSNTFSLITAVGDMTSADGTYTATWLHMVELADYTNIFLVNC